jgi:hypothetical protein
MNMQVWQLREAQRRDAQDEAWPGRVQDALQRLRLDVGQNRRFTTAPLDSSVSYRRLASQISKLNRTCRAGETTGDGERALRRRPQPRRVTQPPKLFRSTAD